MEHRLPYYNDLPGSLSRARYAALSLDLKDDGEMYLAVSKTEPHYFAFTFDPAREALSAQMHQHSLANKGIMFALSAALRANSGKCGVIVDAGASLGSFGLYALHRGCETVHFFEMQQPMVALLKKSIKINQWTERGKVHDRAITDIENEKRWYVNKPQDPASASLWIPMIKWVSPVPVNSVEVYTTRIDSHLKEKIFFMKLDIPGFEMEAIESCWKLFHQGLVDHVTVTFRPNQADVIYTLYGYGYRCRNIKGLSELGVHSLINDMLPKDELLNILKGFPEGALAELWCSYSPPQQHLPPPPKSTDGIEDIAKEPVLYPRKLRFLVAHQTIPLFDIKGSDARLLTILESLRVDGHRLDLIGMTDELVTMAHLSYFRSRPGYRVHPVITLTDDGHQHKEQLNEILRYQEIDVLLLTYHRDPAYQEWINGIIKGVKAQDEKTKIIVLTADIYWRAVERELHGTPDLDKSVRLAKDNEIALYLQASVVGALNANDQLGHLALVPELSTIVVRFAVPQSYLPQILPPWGSRHGLLFVGSNLRTNSDSLHWFLQEVWPLIKRKFSQPDLAFHIAGDVGIAEQFRSDGNIILHGLTQSEELTELFRSCRVFVSPMLRGSGLNIKSVYALNNGIPLVTTLPGVDQLEVPLGNTDRRKVALVCPVRDINCFVDRIYDVYYERNQWEELVENGRRHVEKFFHPNFLRHDLKNLLSLMDGRYSQSLTPTTTTVASPLLRGFPGLKNAVSPKEKERGKVFIGLMVYESARTLGREAMALLSAIDLLGRDKVFVSMLTTGGGQDHTEQVLEDLSLVLKGRGIPTEYTITQHGRQGYFEDRVSYLAKERNIVLEPLRRAENADFSKVLFLNDIIFDPRDLVRLIDTKVEYDMVCGLDFSYATMNIFSNGTINDEGPPGLRFYDMWVTKDMSGNFFQNSAPFSSQTDEGLGAWVNNSNWYSTEPVRVLSCWNGAVVFRASAFTKDNIRFRGHHPGECPSSECTWWCKDMITGGYDRIYVNPAVRFAYETTVWLDLLDTFPTRYDAPTNQLEHHHNAIQQVEWPNKAICCPAKQDGAQWQSCYWTPSIVSTSSGVFTMRPKRLTVVYQGPIYRPIESFAIVNRHLLLWFSRDPEILLIILPTDRAEKAAKDPQFPPDHWHSIVRHVHPDSDLPIEADVWIRSGWPALFHPVQNCVGKCRLVIFQPWEFGSIPKEWADNISSHVWQMWVPSNEVKKMYTKSGVPKEKVMITPHAVNLWEFYGNKNERPESLSEISSKKKFKFLFHGGLLERKGIDILLDAYLREFTKEDDVTLVVHYTYVRKDLKLDKFLSRFNQNNAPDVVWMQKELKLEELARLYASVDTYILPYRSEGFGIPIIEAMASSLPVIVTDKGAAEDFTSDATAFLVASSEQKCSVYPCVDQTICVFCKNDDCQCKETVHMPSWYEPSTESLMKVMRYVYSHPNDRQTRAQAAYEVIQKHFTWDIVAPKIIRQLKASVQQADIQLAQSLAVSSSGNTAIHDNRHNN